MIGIKGQNVFLCSWTYPPVNDPSTYLILKSFQRATGQNYRKARLLLHEPNWGKAFKSASHLFCGREMSPRFSCDARLTWRCNTKPQQLNHCSVFLTSLCFWIIWCNPSKVSGTCFHFHMLSVLFCRSCPVVSLCARTAESMKTTQ